jgi:hypothetical protein
MSLSSISAHLFQPLLYQVATAALSPADVAWPIRSIFAKNSNIRAVLGKVEGIDLEKREVKSDRISVNYDHLVLATGSYHSYFGHDEWAMNALDGLVWVCELVRYYLKDIELKGACSAACAAMVSWAKCRLIGGA